MILCVLLLILALLVDCPFTSNREFNVIPVKIIAYNRLESLKRLLLSLERAALMIPDHFVDVEIFIDYSKDQNHLYDTLCEWIWNHGSFNIIKRPFRFGIRKQWLNSWEPQNELFALILEDDLELSPFAFQYILSSIPGLDETKVYGISLSTLHHSLAVNEWSTTIKPTEMAPCFLFQGASTWGQLIFASAWNEFRLWFRNNPHPMLVDGLITDIWQKQKNSELWSSLFNRWAISSGKMNLYRGSAEALCVSWREDGMNFKAVNSPDSLLLNKKEQFSFPHFIPLYNLCLDRMGNQDAPFLLIVKLEDVDDISMILNWKCWIDLHRFPDIIFLTRKPIQIPLLNVANESDLEGILVRCLRKKITIAMTSIQFLWLNDPFPWLFHHLSQTKVFSVRIKNTPFLFIPPVSAIIISISSILNAIKTLSNHYLVTWMESNNHFPSLNANFVMENYHLIGSVAFDIKNTQFWLLHSDYVCKKVSCPFTEFHKRLGFKE